MGRIERVRRRTNGAVAHRRSDRDQSFRRAAAGRCRSIRRHEEEREFLAQIFVVEPEVLTVFGRRLAALGELSRTTGDGIWPIHFVDQAIGPNSPKCHTISRSASISCKSDRSEEHTSELQSLMRISYAVFCLKKNKDRATITSDKPLKQK